MITSLPWYFHVDHIAGGQSANYALGDGAFDAFNNDVRITTIDSIRRLNVRATTNVGEAQITIPAGRRYVAGFQYRLAAVSKDWPAFQFRAGGTLDLNLYVEQVETPGIRIRRGTTTLELVNVDVNDNVDHYIELAVFLDNAGYYELRVDGVQVALNESVDTTASNSDADQIRLSTIAGFTSHNQYFSQMYLKEWDAEDSPGFLGELEFVRLPLTGDVATQWTPDSGGENFSRLTDDGGIDDDASYIETSDIGDVDEYTLTDLPPAIESVVAVVPYTVATAPAGGTPLIEHGLKRGASESYGAARSLSGAYRTQATTHETAPDGSAWTPAKVDEASMLVRSA